MTADLANIEGQPATIRAIKVGNIQDTLSVLETRVNGRDPLSLSASFFNSLSLSWEGYNLLLLDSALESRTTWSRGIVKGSPIMRQSISPRPSNVGVS